MVFLNPGEVLVKIDSETDPRFGCSPEQRSIKEHINKGFLVLDKPSGPTSHQVVSWIKDIVGVERAGHSGTLDPKVTGVLPVGLLDSTRILQVLLLSGKEYVTFMRLHSDVAESRVREVLDYFVGRIYQTPPVKSAVKRQLRVRQIYELIVLEVDGRDVLFRVDCEAGTYIRKLCFDVGLVLGSGASMKQLRRVRAGPFTEDDVISLHDLKDAFVFYAEDGDESHIREIVQPMESAVSHLAGVWVGDNAVDAVCHGAPVYAPGVCRISSQIKVNELVAVYSLKNELVALGRSLYTSEDILGRDKGKVVDLERVVMSAGVYPSGWGK